MSLTPRMRDGDAAGRSPGTETTVPPLTPLAELLEALRANADDEINRTLDNGAAAAGYRNALHLVEYFVPKIESEAVRRGARIGRRVRGSEAEARQQGRDREAELRTALLGVSMNDRPEPCWCEEWPTDGLHTLQCEQARRALASADGPPEPGEPGLDVERLAAAIGQGFQGRWFEHDIVPGDIPYIAEAIAAEYARLSADGDSPGGAE